MKRRTFLTTLLLFLVFLNSMLCIIVSIMLKDRMEGEKERALSEQYMIASMMWRDLQAFQEKGGLSRENIQTGLQQYKELLRNKKTVFVLCDESGIVFQNRDMGDNLAGLLVEKSKNVEEGYRSTGFLEDVDNSFYIAGALSAPFDSYRLIYSTSLADTLAEWKEFRFLLSVGGIVVSVLLAACLLILIQNIFQPLSEISEISGEIAEGQYEKRLPEKGGNEIADMAVSFNNMADKIQKQILELDTAARQKQEFIDNFAHELKTPLTAIYGYAEYLQKAAVSEADRQEALAFIMSECVRIQNMEKQLINLALLRESDFEKEKIGTEAFLEELYRILLPKAEQKKIRLSFLTQTEYLYGNKGLLQHLLTNLITNAIQSCAQGGKVSVRAYPEQGRNRIMVRDNGRGMEREEIEHITEAFYRIDKSRSREEGGAGLGLAICSKIAEIEHIRLEFSSVPGQGTEAYLTFTTS